MLNMGRFTQFSREGSDMLAVTRVFHLTPAEFLTFQVYQVDFNVYGFWGAVKRTTWFNFHYLHAASIQEYASIHREAYYNVWMAFARKA